MIERHDGFDIYRTDTQTYKPQPAPPKPFKMYRETPPHRAEKYDWTGRIRALLEAPPGWWVIAEFDHHNARQFRQALSARFPDIEFHSRRTPTGSKLYARVRDDK